MTSLKTTLSVTAQPAHISDQVGSVTPAESGLSVDPEDLGKQFLAAAVEQSNGSEWPRGLYEDDFPSDDEMALSEALDLEADTGSLRSWERALLRALADGKSEEEASGFPRSFRGRPLRVERTLSREFDGEQSSHAWDEVDLTDEAIHEASLLDHEGPELGEAIAPSVLKTDDTHTHGKRRRGHLPLSARRASPRAQSGKTLR